MKITMAELMVMMDTLAGSQSISDGGRVFGYSQETREKAWTVIMDRMRSVEFELQDPDLDSPEPITNPSGTHH